MRPIVLLLVLWAFPVAAQDAKLPDDRRSLEFYPSARGTRLEYRLTLDGKAAEFVM